MTRRSPLNLEDLRAAVDHVADRIRGGEAADDELFRSAAASFDIHFELLRRKYWEQYPNGVGQKLHTEKQHLRHRVETLVKQYVEEAPGAVVYVEDAPPATCIERPIADLAIDEWCFVRIDHKNASRKVLYKAHILNGETSGETFRIIRHGGR